MISSEFPQRRRERAGEEKRGIKVGQGEQKVKDKREGGEIKKQSGGRRIEIQRRRRGKSC